MAGKRRNEEENLIEAVAYADTAHDKLRAAEEVLAQRIDAVEGETVSLVELELIDEEIKWIDLQVGHALTGTSVEELLAAHPRMVLASLAGAAMRADTDATFWADWLRRTGITDPDFDTDKVDRQIPAMMRAARLKAYGVADTADSNVNQIRLHVGITASGMQALVEAYLDEEVSATRLALAIQKDETAPWTLREFLRLEPTLAAYLITSVTEFIDYTLDTPDWYAAERRDVFEGHADLPSLMFAELVHVLAHRDEYGREGTPTERVFTRPRIWLDDALGTVHLRLTLPTGEHEADWVLSSPSGVRRVRQAADETTVDQPAHDVALQESAPAFTVSLPAHGREWDMDLFHPDKPVIFFNVDTGRRVGRIRRLRATEVLAVAPAQTTFTGDDGVPVHDPAQATELRSWAGWQMYRLDLSSTSSVDVAFDQISTRLNVQLDRRSKMRFGTSDPIPGMVGPDGRPVFGSSPTITVPASETGEWTRRIFFIDGEERQDVFGVPLICEIGATTPIFGDSSDVWIGRFDVHVFHNGRFVASRIYNMAESMAVTFEYEASYPLDFRYPEATPTAAGLTVAHYQLNYVGEKDFEVSDEWGELDSDHLTSPEVLESGEGYTLEPIIVPQRLTFRIDRVDRAGTWRSFPEAIDTDVLDPDGDVVIRLPEKANSAELTLVDLGRPQEGGRTVALDPVDGRTFRAAISALARFYHGAETVMLSLTWNSDAMLAEVSTKRSRTRAAKKGRTANLGLLTRQPLLVSAAVEDGVLTLEPAQTAARFHVWAWPLSDLSGDPVELDVDPVTYTAELPPELADADALVIDAAETGFVLDPVAPTVPSARALLVGAAEEKDVDLEQAWAGENLLAALNHPSAAARSALQEHPRAALCALSESPLGKERRVAAFISSGLVARPFTAAPDADTDTDTDTDPQFWASALADVSDLLTLAAAGAADSAEATAKLTHLRQLGGPGLVDTLRSGWAVGDTFASINKAERAFLDMYEGALLNGVPPVPQPWASENRRRQALTELYSRRHLIAHLGVVPGLVEQVIRLENRVLKNAQTTVLAMQATQRSEAQDQGDPMTEPWAWVPYISTTLSFLARQRAHDVIGPIRGGDAVFHAWAKLAAVVPQLTITDILLADATVASTRHNVVPEIAVEPAPVVAVSTPAPPTPVAEEPEVQTPVEPEPEVEAEVEPEPEVEPEVHAPAPAPSFEELAAAVIADPEFVEEPEAEAAPKPKTEPTPVVEKPVKVEPEKTVSAPAPAKEVPAAKSPEPRVEKPAEPAEEAVPISPTQARNRAVIDIHRALIGAISSFVGAALPEDATPEELMLRAGFVGDIVGRIRAYPLNVDKDSRADLAELLKQAEVHAKTTGSTAKLEAFLKEELQVLKEQ
ncbi:hypothetical protein [Corynebacterium guangdongense]|uniref:Uncharacterized protein n=1 Tax=Corynebacterium guangdongense TaxID=1783348 RepID=A0ABU1ZTW0_9CORY|nr:hypothetical protein [Corynebacterium guangdongense]MDR7328367.1 hypothetical protein [Corynebacterium guangdongense]WJZ16944.1 hypothetical protein CGUA_01720 [Corynebacterium guangdongense]